MAIFLAFMHVTEKKVYTQLQRVVRSSLTEELDSSVEVFVLFFNKDVFVPRGLGTPCITLNN